MIIGILSGSFFIYRNVSDYVKTRNSLYGRKANNERVNHKIPIIEDYMKPSYAPYNKYYGVRWRSSMRPNKRRKLVHLWKRVDADELGWNREDDAFGYYINDTTYYQINLDYIFHADTVERIGKLNKIDSRKIDFSDYLSRKYPSYDWRELNQLQIDSVLTKWKIN